MTMKAKKILREMLHCNHHHSLPHHHPCDLILCNLQTKATKDHAKAGQHHPYQFLLLPNVTLGLSIQTDIVVKNPNYADLKCENSTTSIYYGGIFVGDAPTKAGKIGARSTKVISTVVDVLVDKVVASPRFFPDVFRRSLNMTAASGTEGKVALLGLFKQHAKVHMSCDVSIFIWQGNDTSTCNSKVKL